MTKSWWVGFLTAKPFSSFSAMQRNCLQEERGIKSSPRTWNPCCLSSSSTTGTTHEDVCVGRPVARRAAIEDVVTKAVEEMMFFPKDKIYCKTVSQG
jgi:hypothetical protein